MTETSAHPRVLITSWICQEDNPALSILRELGCEIVFQRRPQFRDEASMLEIIDGANAVVAASDAYTERVLSAAPLRIVSRVGVGYDSIDLAAATARGIVVATTPGANNESVADHTFSLILSLARMVLPQDRDLRAGKWTRLNAADVHGQTLGILGLGKIGKGVARRARGFDMRVVAYDPFWDAAFAAENHVERLALDDVIGAADFLTLHLPASPQTRKLMDASKLALMKPTAYLINAARGSLVDEAALYAALTSRRIAGAGLDVFDREPPWGSPLIGLENVVVTPHVAGFSVKANEAGVRMAIESIALVLQGKRPHFCVNPEVFG